MGKKTNDAVAPDSVKQCGNRPLGYTMHRNAQKVGNGMAPLCAVEKMPNSLLKELKYTELEIEGGSRKVSHEPDEKPQKRISKSTMKNK